MQFKVLKIIMGVLFSPPYEGHARITIESDEKHKRTLIWLHGINAYAEEFESIF